MAEIKLVHLVDDEAPMRKAIEQWLGLAGLTVVAHADPERVLSELHQDFPGILVSDIKMPKVDGLQVLARALARDPDLPVVLITGHGDIRMAVEAMRRGAYDFIEKPFEPQRLLESVRRACEKRRLVLENRRLRQQVGTRSIESRIIGTSAKINALRREILELASTDVSVVVQGETGCGKELVARCLHDFSARREERFVAVNCGAIPELIFESEFFGHETGAFTGASGRRVGKFEYARGGTLFLDEVEAMPLFTQIKVLRALQERSIERLGSNETIHVDVRPVAATKIDLYQAAERGTFRSDLYYRLNVAEVHVPPLRERGEDIPLLFEYFGAEAARRHGRELRQLTEAAWLELMGHSWPGNVRELRNVAERYALGLSSPTVLGLIMQTSAAATALTARQPLATQIDSFEKRVIEQALQQLKGNIAATMAYLEVPRRTLNEKMTRYSIDRRRFVED